MQEDWVLWSRVIDPDRNKETKETTICKIVHAERLGAVVKDN